MYKCHKIIGILKTFIFLIFGNILAANASDYAWKKVVPENTGLSYKHLQYPSWGNRTHFGIDIIADCEKNIFPMLPGEIVKVHDSTSPFFSSIGNAIMLRHPGMGPSGNDIYTIYLHMKDSPKNLPDFVNSDTLIGRVGDTGSGFGCHTHFEIRNFYHENAAGGGWFHNKSICNGRLNIYSCEDTRATDWAVNDWINPETYSIAYSCKKSTEEYFELETEKRCYGYHVSKNGIFSIDQKIIIQDMIGGYSTSNHITKRLPIEKIRIFQKSPYKNYQYIEGCDTSFCAYGYIVNLNEKTAIKTYAGKYGTNGKLISWSPDENYLIAPYYYEGVSLLYLIRVLDGKVWTIFNDETGWGHVDFSRLNWIDNKNFELPVFSCVNFKNIYDCKPSNQNLFSVIKYTIGNEGPKKIDKK